MPLPGSEHEGFAADVADKAVLVLLYSGAVVIAEVSFLHGDSFNH